MWVTILHYIFYSDSAIAFVGGAVGAFFGALGAAYIISRREKVKHDEQLLSAINSTCVLLDANIDILAMMKQQLVLPMIKDVEEFPQKLRKAKEEMRQRGDGILHIPPSERIFQIMAQPRTEFMFNFEVISQYAHISVAALKVAARAKDAFNSVIDGISQRNEVVDQIIVDPRDATIKLSEYLGMNPRKVDLRLLDMSRNLANSIDAALWFLRETIRRVEELGELALPEDMKRRVVKIELPSKVKILMPPDDYMSFKT